MRRPPGSRTGSYEQEGVAGPSQSRRRGTVHGGPRDLLAAALAALGIAVFAAPSVAEGQDLARDRQASAPRLLAQGQAHVRIRDLDDIDMGTWNGFADMVGADAVCVFSSTQVYTVTARGSGSGGAFELSAIGGSNIPYSVEWADEDSRTETLGAGSISGPMSARTNSASCQGGTNATVTVRLSAASAAQGLAGILTGVLILEISPSN